MQLNFRSAVSAPYVRPGRPIGAVLAMLLAAIIAAPPASAQVKPPLAQLLQTAGTSSSDVSLNDHLQASPTRSQQLPLFRSVMARPLDAPYRAGVLAHAYKRAASSPHDLIGLTGAVAGVGVQRSAESALVPLEAALRNAPDPLAASLARMGPDAGSAWPPMLPDSTELADPLRFELALVLSAIWQSNQFLQRAFARLPHSVTPGVLRRQAVDGRLGPFEEPDFRQLLGLIEREALLAGMLDLVAAIERLRRFVSAAPQLPALAWTLQTPMGRIVVDTTGRDNRHQLADALLVLDVGGDDEYEFLPRSDGHRISVLLDHRGNDRYVTGAPGADPSSATLGFGVLWDTEGDDAYVGTQQAQASAVFGAALLVDQGGANRFTASGHSQGYAIGGVAVLLGSPGDDRFTAQTYAQGSAGPLAAAALIDPGGNDQYTLSNTPLIRPSPQLPDRNVSMGQGAGRGLRGIFADGRSATGGIGMLMDLAGDDVYSAQVFAQGVGYYEGLGLLVDDGGNDRFDAAWYAMGAGVHSAAGILLKRGTGNDHYRASHSSAIGAANDFSVGIFVDESGDDDYTVGDVGLGAALENGIALFVDGRGDDRYHVGGAACGALGAARIGRWGTARENLLNLGLFMDLAGADRYPPACAGAADNARWTTPRAWPQLDLRSEAGAGLDGEWPMPFPIRPLTAEPDPQGRRR